MIRWGHNVVLYRSVGFGSENMHVEILAGFFCVTRNINFKNVSLRERGDRCILTKWDYDLLAFKYVVNHPNQQDQCLSFVMFKISSCVWFLLHLRGIHYSM